MRECEQMRRLLAHGTGPLARWRGQLHQRWCRNCSAQRAADAEAEAVLRSLLTSPDADTFEERAALARVQQYWQETLPEAPGMAVETAPRRVGTRGWMTASAAVGLATLAFIGFTLTKPSRALAQVQGAMARVRCFHVRMEVVGFDVRYEAWGERDRGARVEEWEAGQQTLVLLDDGKSLRRYSPLEHKVREGETRLNQMFREAAGFQASRMLRQAAGGKLFEGQEWLGEATAREVSQVQRDGRPQRRLHVDLKNGFFERMVIYADVETDRLEQANLYTDSRSPDEEPFARVFFDYPEKLDAALFRLKLPEKVPVERTEANLLRP